MFTITREINFCYGHRLLGYPGKCCHLHGHNGRVELMFEAQGLDPRGMVFDFSEIKRAISGWIDENLDHRMILERGDPAVVVLEKLGEPLYLMDASPTAENIARVIAEAATRQGFSVVEVRLWETPHCSAAYRPNDS